MTNLELNQNYMKINNELIKMANKNQKFEKGLAYIANNVFLYYNSIRIINDTDPNKYPKKNYDQVILQSKTNEDSEMTKRPHFQRKLTFFNSEFKKTVALHKDIWISVNNNLNMVDGKLYEAAKNCLENLQKIQRYTRKNLLEFTKGFVGMPDYSSEGSTQEYKMDLYYPSYTGNIEHHEYEKWVLIKLGFIKQKAGKFNAHDNKVPNYAKHTQVSIRGKEVILKDNDVTQYYSLRSEPPELVELLFTHCLYKSYAAEMPDTKRNHVRIFRERLVIEQKNDTRNSRSIWKWIDKEFSKRYRERMQITLATFFNKVKGILERRAQRVEAAKNIVKSFVHKFKIEHATIDTQTESNFLLNFKDSIGRKTGYMRSRFCNEYELNMIEFQTRHELIDLQGRQCNRLQPIALQRQASQEWKYLQPAEKHLNDPNYKEYLHWRTIDRHKLTSDLKYHYAINLSKEQRPALWWTNQQSEKQVMVKQLGPEVNIEQSVAEINRKTLHYLIDYHERATLVRSNITIDGRQLSMNFNFSPTSNINCNTTKLLLNLELPLVDYKEQLLKSNDIKFQSCYPIVYHFLANEHLRKAFLPSKADGLSKKWGVQEITVTSILNSMGSFLLSSVLVSDHSDRAEDLSAVRERQLQADSLHQVRPRRRAVPRHDHLHPQLPASLDSRAQKLW